MLYLFTGQVFVDANNPVDSDEQPCYNRNTNIGDSLAEDQLCLRGNIKSVICVLVPGSPGQDFLLLVSVPQLGSCRGGSAGVEGGRYLGDKISL